MVDAADAQASLESVLKDEIIRMSQEVAENPDSEFHFFHGRQAAELLGYDAAGEHAGIGRGVWREGRDDDGAQAGSAAVIRGYVRRARP